VSKQALHDLRAVYDVVSLRAERVAAAAWVLVELRPDPYSGGAMTVGASVDGATGKLIDDATGRELAPEEARTGLVFSGEWKIVDASAAPSGRYSWIEPPKVRLQGLAAKDLYDPLASGGVVLCDLDLQASGREQFGRVRLIFADWTTSSAESRVAFQANPDLLASTDLLSIVDGTNDVLSVLAFHTLDEQLDALTRARGPRLAAFVYMLGHHPDDAVETELAARGAALADPRWFVLGVCAARLFEPTLRFSQEWAPRLVAPYRTVSDPYVQECLRVAGLDG
jgi:hypothetical protein